MAGGRPAKRKTEMKKCQDCLRTIAKDNNFYSTDNEMFKDGRIPICKKCVKEQVDETDIESVKKFLRQIDKPFIWEEWKKCFESPKETIGWYLRQINSLHQYKHMTYENSKDKTKDEKYNLRKTVIQNEADNLLVEDEDGEIIEVTPKVIHKWGDGYSTKQYIELEQTWSEMMRSNRIETPQHRKQLFFYCKLTVKMDDALERDIEEYAKLSTQYNKLLQTSGFRPIDKAAGNEEAGMRSFAQIYDELEKDGYIEPAKYNGVSQDIIDLSIMYMLNYQLKLHNMPILIEPPEDTPKLEDADRTVMYDN